MAVTFPIANGAIIEVTFQGLLDAQVVMTVLHYRYTGAVQADGPGLLGNFVSNLVSASGEYTRWLQASSEDLTNCQIKTQLVSPTRYIALIWPPTTTVGQVAQPALPPGTTVCVTKYANIADRAGRGAVHMPAVPTTFVANGVTTLAGNTAYALFANSLSATFAPTLGGEITPVIYHRTLPSASPTVSVAFAKNVARTMRRRVVGRGI